MSHQLTQITILSLWKSPEIGVEISWVEQEIVWRRPGSTRKRLYLIGLAYSQLTQKRLKGVTNDLQFIIFLWSQLLVYYYNRFSVRSIIIIALYLSIIINAYPGPRYD